MDTLQRLQAEGQGFDLATRVSLARGKFNMSCRRSGHPDFERVFRLHANTLEWLPIFLPLLWLCAIYFSDRAAAVLGLHWLGGRAMYFVGYGKAVDKRLPNFFVQSMACVLLVGAIVGLVSHV